MKCPACSVNHPYRNGMTCSCGYRFTLNPKTDELGDGRFVAIANAASGNDTFYFTENQLRAAYCRRSVRHRGWFALAGLLICCGIGSIAWFVMRPGGGAAWFWTLALATFGAVGIPWAIMRYRPDQEVVNRALAKWLDAGKPLPRLLSKPSLQEPPPNWPEPDIYDYGVESLLVVDRDILVDMFVKNDFHAQQRCLIISQTGYPKYLEPLVAKALGDRGDLPVFLLHDAFLGRGPMRSTVERQLGLALGDHPVIDLGLFPTDVRRIKRLHPMLRGRTDYQLPVDYIAYAVLASGMTQALDEQLTLAGVLSAQAASGGYDSGSFG